MSKPTIKPKDFKCYYNFEMQLIGGVRQCATALSAGGTFDKFYR